MTVGESVEDNTMVVRAELPGIDPGKDGIMEVRSPLPATETTPPAPAKVAITRT